MTDSGSDDFAALAMPGVKRAAPSTSNTTSKDGGRQFPLLSIALVGRTMCGFFVVDGVQPLPRGMVAEDDAQTFEWTASSRTRVASQSFVIWRSALAVATPPHRLEKIGRQRVLKLTGDMRAYLGLASDLPGSGSIGEVMREALANKGFDAGICLEGLRAWVMPASIGGDFPRAQVGATSSRRPPSWTWPVSGCRCGRPGGSGPNPSSACLRV